VLRVVLALAAVLAAVVLWYLGARTLALAAESATAEIVATPHIDRIGWNGTYLLVGGRIRGLTGSNDAAILRLGVDSRHRLIAEAGGRTIALATQSPAPLPDGSESIDAFAPEPGDRVTLTRARGRIAWPNWFELNFMTGNTPSWKRFVTDRLVWTKPSGATLTLLWRYEEYYYDSEGRWMGADMVGPDSCGLVQAEIAGRNPQ